MQRRIFSWTMMLFLLPVLFLGTTGYSAAPAANRAAGLPAGRERLPAPDLSQLPLSFIPNAGQNAPLVRFQAHTMGGTIFFTPAEVVLSLPTVADQSTETAGTTVRLRFEETNPTPQITEAQRLPGVANYFLGDDPARWRTDLPTYNGVIYQELYDGIDLAYEGTVKTLKGTYLVAPGADPGRIRWHYEGVTAVRLDKATGDLLLDLPATGSSAVADEASRTLIEAAPIAWQDIAGQRIPVEASYNLAIDGSIGFTLGAYDATQPLTIDPSLTYSTLVGGSGGDEGRDIDVDSEGNVYITGSTLSTNFPNAGPPQSDYAGPPSGNFGDAFIAKLDPTGETLVYMTYLGGSGAEVGDRLTIDAAGNVYVTGMTESTNFPTQNAFQSQNGGQSCSNLPCADAFVTKLNAAGNDLVFSTYLGGEREENLGLLDVGTLDTRTGIAVDSNNNVYVTGRTDSPDFPTLANPAPAFTDGDGAFFDIFLAKLRPDGQALLYSTYLGGDGADFSGGVAVDNAGIAYLTGATLADNFPTKNAFQNTANSAGVAEAIVAKFDTTKSGAASWLYSSYLGGNDADFGLRIEVDNAGNMYLAGHTTSLDFPTENPLQATNASTGQPIPRDAFVTKLNPAGNALLYSTYLGGGQADVSYDMDIDAQGNVYVTGTTNSDNFPVKEAWQEIRSDFRDIFVTKIDPTKSGAASLVHSTFLGNVLNDYSYGIAVDSEGSAYVTGITAGVTSDEFPIYATLGPNGANDGVLVAKLGPPRVTGDIYLPIVIKSR